MSLRWPAARSFRVVRGVLLFLGLPYATVVVALFLLQRQVLYQSEVYSLPALAKQCAAEDLQPWPSSISYRGLLAEPRPQVIRGTVLVLHGNAGSATDRVDYGNVVMPLGYRLVLLEYPGYGARPGQPSEVALASDAAESIQMARAQFGAPIFLLGESLGSGVAAAAVAKVGRAVDGVVLATPWDNLPHVAQSLIRFLPVKWLVKDRFDSEKNLADYPGPLVIVMAGQDELIPNDSTLALHASFKGVKQLATFKRATHNTWLGWTERAWWEGTMDFLNHPGR